MFVILLNHFNIWTNEFTRVQSQQMAFTQSPSSSNNPKILTNYLIWREFYHPRHKAKFFSMWPSCSYQCSQVIYFMRCALRILSLLRVRRKCSRIHVALLPFQWYDVFEDPQENECKCVEIGKWGKRWWMSFKRTAVGQHLFFCS